MRNKGGEVGAVAEKGSGGVDVFLLQRGEFLDEIFILVGRFGDHVDEEVGDFGGGEGGAAHG